MSRNKKVQRAEAEKQTEPLALVTDGKGNAPSHVTSSEPWQPTFEHTVIRCRPGDFDKTAKAMMGWELVSATPVLERVPGGQTEVYVTFWKRLEAKETR